MKMDDFPAKLVVIAALVLLLMGDFQATRAILLPHGRGKSSLWHIDCRDGLADIHIGRKQGSFGCQGENFSKKIMPIRRSLRPITVQKPSSPTKNGRKQQFLPPLSPRRPLPPHPPPPPSSNDSYSPGS